MKARVSHAVLEPLERPAQPLAGTALTVGTPDPLVTANVYCSGKLGGVIACAILPFWRELQRLDERGACYVWLLRYAKGGEHLKVRVHGPDSVRSGVRRLLQNHVEAYLAELGPPEDGAVRHCREIAAPIDREDYAAEDRPDRSFLWTGYRRSIVSLGHGPFLEDDGYLARLTLCLGRGTELLLGRLATDAVRELPHGAVQASLLQGVIHALAAAGLPPDRRTAYLLYHRDWLLRAVRKQSGHPASAKKMREILERFDRRIAEMAGAEEGVRQRAAAVWSGAEPEWPDAPTAAWAEAVTELARQVARRSGDRAYHVDAFAADPVDVALFKVLHGFANQLGSTPLNEAFAYHLLHVVTCPPDRRHEPVRLVPG